MSASTINLMRPANFSSTGTTGFFSPAIAAGDIATVNTVKNANAIKRLLLKIFFIIKVLIVCPAKCRTDRVNYLIPLKNLMVLQSGQARL